MEAFFILICTYATSIFEGRVLQRTKKIEWITFGLCSFMFLPLLSRDTFWLSQCFFTFLFCLFEQDRHTYYISWHWSIACVCIAIGFIGTFQSLHWQGALLYSVPALFLHRRKPEWIGIADVYFLGFFRFSFRDASYDDCGIDFCSFWSFMVRFQAKEDDRLRVLFMYRSLDFLCKGVLSVGYFIQSFKHILGSSGHSI